MVRLHVISYVVLLQKQYLPEHNVPSQHYARALFLSQTLRNMPDAAQNNFEAYSLSGSVVTFDSLNFIYDIFGRFSQKESNKIEEVRTQSKEVLCKNNFDFNFRNIDIYQM